MQALIDEVLPALESAMASVGIQGDYWRQMLNRSKEASQGDLALPCFPFAKQLSCSPDEAAQQIADALHLDMGQAIAVGPYVNIRASMDWLATQLSRTAEPKGSILIEHTSANPNGPFHVGRARNAVLGDTFSRMHHAAGYDVKGRIREKEKNPQNLIPIVMEVASGMRSKMEIFGNDYKTQDGTGVRDYIHVNDLATAHVQAMKHISNTKEDIVVNLATGDGHSVLDVIHKTIEVSGNDIPYDIVGRRTGDPGTVLAVSKKAFALLNWSPGHSALDTLIRSVWEVYR